CWEAQQAKVAPRDESAAIFRELAVARAFCAFGRDLARKICAKHRCDGECDRECPDRCRWHALGLRVLFMSEAGRVVVIGTGPAGATAALFLSRAGLEPLVLEAGSGKAALGLTARIKGVTIAKWKP